MNLRYYRSTALALVVAIGAASLPFTAAADEKADLARGKQLFTDALALEQSGSYPAALSKFQEVLTIKKTPQIEFHIARCLEKTGKLVEALAGYKQASADAAPNAAKDPRLQEVVTESDAAVVSLDKRIPSLTVKRGAGATAASATLDGKAIASADLGKLVPLNPGTYTVEASATGKQPFKEQVTLAEGDAKTVEIKLKDKDGPAPATSAEPLASSSAPVEPPPPEPEKSSALAPIVLGGIGLVAFAAGGAFYAVRGGAKSDLDAACHGSICPASEQPTGNRGKTMTTLGNVSMVVGGVFVAGGITLFAVQRASSKPAATPSGDPSAPSAGVSARVTAFALPGATGASLVGSF